MLIITADLKVIGPKWMVARNSNEAERKAIEFSLQLWMMVKPGPLAQCHDSSSLRETVAQSFSIPSMLFLSANTSHQERLLPDSGVKNLIGIGSFEII